MADTLKIRYRLVPTDGAVIRSDPTPWELTVLQGLVHGYIEAIGGHGWTAYLNEEAKLDGLAPNPRADRLARLLGWQPSPGDHLVGLVVFVGVPDDQGDDTDVEQTVVALAVNHAGDPSAPIAAETGARGRARNGVPMGWAPRGADVESAAT